MTDHLPLEFTFRAPTLPLSTNESNRLHWAERRARLESWKQAGHVYTLKALRRVGFWRPARGCTPVPVVVALTLPFRTDQRRDPHNYVGTNVKAFVDGMVLAGLIPDDNREWATIVEPPFSIQRDRTVPLMASVLITERTSP